LRKSQAVLGVSGVDLVVAVQAITQMLPGIEF